MKRVQYLRYGAPEELRLDEVTPPDAGRGQIRVQVRAAAANPMDWKIRRGEMKALTGFRFPRGLGHDFAGVVEAVGPGVKRLEVGDEVFGVTSIRQAGVDSDAKCNPVDSIGSSTKSRVSHSERRRPARFPGDKDGSARRKIEPLQ
jgi:NADPH:quinone reductase-like Zn-dependent oxidoreductase